MSAGGLARSISATDFDILSDVVDDDLLVVCRISRLVRKTAAIFMLILLLIDDEKFFADFANLCRFRLHE